MDKQELIALQLKALDWWYEGFGSGDIDHAYRGFADDVTWSGLGKQAERATYTGKQAVINYQKAWVHNVWAGSITYIPKHTLCDGNVLMAEWEDEAIVAATGEKYTNGGIFVWEYDGKPLVQRARVWFDAGPLRGEDRVGMFAAQNVATS
jgi:ketosteroid isomerase-like protein